MQSLARFPGIGKGGPPYRILGFRMSVSRGLSAVLICSNTRTLISSRLVWLSDLSGLAEQPTAKAIPAPND